MVSIHDTQELLLSSDADVFRQQISTVLACMRSELDDHRLAVNENTDELIATNECVSDLSRKIDKLAERLDELALLIRGPSEQKGFTIRPLTGKEKEVFSALYNLTETQAYASYEQIARKALSTKSIVADLVTSMMAKGVPIVKRLDGTTIFLKLDGEFREIQAKENRIGLSAPLTAWLPRS